MMKKNKFILTVMSLLFLGNTLIFVAPCAASELFPTYPGIKSNVAFWKKVYTKYSTTQGIIHDSNNLGIIYEVIDLEKQGAGRARKINRKRIKKAKEKYEKILRRLLRKRSASAPEARRVVKLFGWKGTRATFRKAMRNIRCQVGQKDRFRKGIIRSGAYFPEIKRIFRSQGLPLDLAYLPHVESSFNYKAHSKSGATGIWQFTRATGKRFLALSYALDERRDPIRSSYAAARLLKENYKKLGSWPMAITAYNHGIAGMLRAKKARGSYEAIFKRHKSRLFGFASRNFYSEFLAAREAAKNYQQYFGDLKLNSPGKSRKVVLNGYASIKDLARHFKVDITAIRNLNPSLRKPVYNGQKDVPKGYELRLPYTTDRSSLNLSTGLPPDIYKPRQKPSRFYRVQKGDTAGEIAWIHRVKLSDLILANHLDSRATIYIRQKLRLPVPGEVLDKPAKDKPFKKTGKKAEISRVLNSSANRHRPKSISKIVPKIELSPSKAAPPTLQLPVKPVEREDGLLLDRVMTQQGKRIGIVRVVPEETLGHYAVWLGISTQSIRRLNRFDFGKTIRVNQEVKIPLDEVPKEQFEKKRLGYHKGREKFFFDSYKIENVQTYQIKNGDNIWTLCNEVFEVPFWLIKKYNPGLDFNRLRPLQKVSIPVVAERDHKPGKI